MFGKYVRPITKKVKTIIPEFFASTTASAANSSTITINSTTYTIGQNFDCTIHCTSGNVWINPLTTATTNSFKLISGMLFDVTVQDTLSIISDSTTAKVQAIIWED